MSTWFFEHHPWLQNRNTYTLFINDSNVLYSLQLDCLKQPSSHAHFDVKVILRKQTDQLGKVSTHVECKMFKCPKIKVRFKRVNCCL